MVHSVRKPVAHRLVTAVGAGALLVIALASTTAAAASTKLTVKYRVTGSTLLKAPNATASLGPGTLKSTVNLSTGTVTASLSIAGLPVPVGNSCESATPAVVTVTSQSGFSIVNGGTLAGTYTIPPFANCGLLITPVLNLTVPGPGNTISLKLGKAQRVG